MAESSDYTHLHRSIDQLRLMNDRGLFQLNQLSTNALVHNYKPFNINDLRNSERLEYGNKINGIDVRTSTANVSGNNNSIAPNNVERIRHDQQQQQHQHQQDQKTHSSPSTPPTPHSNADRQTSKSKLSNATKAHLRATKPYKCTQCTKSFANSSYLSQHSRIHLEIKPYGCEICQRKFTQLAHLQQHVRTHTGDKPYKCPHPDCEKAFSQLSNLQSHSRSHQTDRPYKCNSCYKCFADEMALLEHIPKHKKSKHLKMHICQYCGKSYTQETYLTKHMQKHAERPDKRSSISAGLNSAQMNHNVGTTNGEEHSYWPKLTSESVGSNAVEAMQQQQQNQYDFALGQQHKSGNGDVEHMQNHHHRALISMDSHRNSNGGGRSHETDDDLVIQRQNSTNLAQHLVAQNVIASAAAAAAAADVTNILKTTSSAFTSINPMTHLNGFGHHSMAPQRPYLYDNPINFQYKNTQQNGNNSIPNQFIALHQIRNYAHQANGGGSGAGDGMLSTEQLLSIGVGAKDKRQ